MNKPKGTKDIFGKRQSARTRVQTILRAIANLYNYKEIETPIFERAEVFKRAVGETSDIVSKEMYEFNDKKGRSMVLRPEGTAGTIRAIVENKIYANPQANKLFYMGPMFRYENPQKGRQRQFTQFGVEQIEERNPLVDAEVILMADHILKTLGLDYELVINSLGDKKTRDDHSKALRKYLDNYKDQLSADSLKRLDKNPSRILDDKIDGKKEFIKNAPKISDFYSNDVKQYFDTVTEFLKNMGIEFTIDHTLVRGLDYYTDTAFEFISKSKDAGAQSTLIGGGRYSNLIKQFGGPDLSGIGFGLGIERIVNDVESQENGFDEKLDIFVLNISDKDQQVVAGLVHMLRQAGFSTEWNNKSGKLQKVFKIADKYNASFKIIAGAKELSQGNVEVKFENKQETVEITKLIDYLNRLIGDKNEKY